MTSVLPSHLAEELVGLRRRAYGPDADIDSDPAALTRLLELEGVSRLEERAEEADAPDVSAEPIAPAMSAEPTAPAVSAEPTGPDVPTEGAPVATAPGDPQPQGRRWWSSPVLLAAAAVVALVVLAGSLVTTLDSRPDCTLTPTPAAAQTPFPDGLSWLTSALGIPRDALRSYPGVGDITVWAGTSEDGVDCVLVTGPSGPFGFGCSRGRDATADIVLDSTMNSIPTGLAERSTLRFVYRGDRVDVWIDEP